MTNFLLNLLPTIAGILLGICYIPQLFKTYKTKDVRSMSTAFWIILNVALTFLAINAYVVFATSGVWGYAVTETFNEGLALVQLIMVLKYRNNVKPVTMPAVPQKQKIGFSIDVSGNATVSGNTSGNATSGNAQ
jgi:uncharacterized protein with PQ loop repeat